MFATSPRSTFAGLASEIPHCLNDVHLVLQGHLQIQKTGGDRLRFPYPSFTYNAMEDIRDIAANADPKDPFSVLGLHHWHLDPQHPGHAYCYTITDWADGDGQGNYRIHIARIADHRVVGSFPSFATADATMLQLYQLERSAAQLRPKQSWYLSPTEGMVPSGWPA